LYLNFWEARNMGLFDKLLGTKKTSSAFPDAHESDKKNYQLPSAIVAKEFGEVDVLRLKDHTEVVFTILMEPTGKSAEGWQTGVALDASISMQDSYGRGLEPGPAGDPSNILIEEYRTKGWMKTVKHKGVKYQVPGPEAKEDLVKRGYFRWSINEVEPLARKMTEYLASNLDARGKTTALYWACGDGSSIEVIGDFSISECALAAFSGPKSVEFGTGTLLTPALNYFVKRYETAPCGMFIFITDGELDDLDNIKEDTINLCKEIEVGRRNPIKCVLIGVGSAINEDQMAELDDLDSGTGIDIWDHKIARDMRSLMEIFAEVVDENQIVAHTARIYDSTGNVVKNFTDGLPAKVRFSLPPDAAWFELEVEGRRIKQILSP
jgi:hypothetical protein